MTTNRKAPEAQTSYQGASEINQDNIITNLKEKQISQSTLSVLVGLQNIICEAYKRDGVLSFGEFGKREIHLDIEYFMETFEEYVVDLYSSNKYDKCWVVLKDVRFYCFRPK